MDETDQYRHAIDEGLITIHDAGGFARAAEILHMTQPAISQQMRRLEELIGQPLFERHGRSMLLNMQGETLLGYARQFVALNDEAISHLSGVKRERETVILGMPEHFSDTTLHLIIPNRPPASRYPAGGQERHEPAADRRTGTGKDRSGPHAQRNRRRTGQVLTRSPSPGSAATATSSTARSPCPWCCSTANACSADWSSRR